MKNSLSSHAKCTLGLIMFVFALSLGHGIVDGGFFRPAVVEAKITQGTVVPDAENIVFDKNNPDIKAVMAIQGRHSHQLLAIPQVIGTATGLTATGRPAVLVFAGQVVGAGVIPEILEGVPVVVHVTGKFFAMKAPPPKGQKIDPTAGFPRPVPIGVSTGNAWECSAGTIGARVKGSGGKVYALSNNHVYALENTAFIGSEVLQPGLYDTHCTYDPNNVIGTLSSFVPIDFSGGENKVDAAVAHTTTGYLGNATPANGYGVPASNPVPASIGQAVQKCGRTTSLTRGAITGINATVKVIYSSGTATFVDQIIVTAPNPFIKAGDSGSLLVTDPGRNPVGLLFAGNSSGKFAIANPIDAVLGSFRVTIDSEP